MNRKLVQRKLVQRKLVQRKLVQRKLVLNASWFNASWFKLVHGSGSIQRKLVQRKLVQVGSTQVGSTQVGSTQVGFNASWFNASWFNASWFNASWFNASWFNASWFNASWSCGSHLSLISFNCFSIAMNDSVPESSNEDTCDRVSIPPLSESDKKNARLGMRLFFIYLVMYLVFVLVNAFSADTMETPAIAGLNLAIVYGFGLIITALVMAFIYGALCKTDPTEEAQ